MNVEIAKATYAVTLVSYKIVEGLAKNSIGYGIKHIIRGRI